MYTIINTYMINTQSTTLECSVANFSSREAAQDAFRKLMLKHRLCDKFGKFLDESKSDGEATTDALFDSLVSCGNAFFVESEDGDADTYFIRNEKVRREFKEGDEVFL